MKVTNAKFRDNLIKGAYSHWLTYVMAAGIPSRARLTARLGNLAADNE